LEVSLSRTLAVAMIALVGVVPPALAQAPPGAPASPTSDPQAGVKAELRALFESLRDAAAKKDRAALERLYADEFLFVHSTGSVVDKARQVEGILAGAGRGAPPIPALDGLYVNGDVAILRAPVRGVAMGTSVFVRRDGRWQFFQAQGTRLAPERRPVAVEGKVLDGLAGRYSYPAGAMVTITRDGEALKAELPGRPTIRLVPLSEVHFAAQDNDAEVLFTRDDAGRTTGYVMRIGTCQESKATRVE
jgi:hypothetical protein